jgi:hypothetical protein
MDMTYPGGNDHYSLAFSFASVTLKKFNGQADMEVPDGNASGSE